jgi:glycosyltransferase involved in cell wall biosynthesis
MIFRNAADFIQEAIESVLAQTWADWTLLLVGDGSTEPSTVIARSYVEHFAQKVSYFALSYHQIKGMSAWRNLGTRNVKVNLLLFLTRMTSTSQPSWKHR